MDKYQTQLLYNNIIKIEDKILGLQDLKNFKIDTIIHKYSNTKVPLYRFFKNDNIITRNNNINVTYKCISCNSIHIVCLNNILRKINKNISKCRICKELDEFKKLNHSIYMTNIYPLKKIDIREKIELTDKLKDDINKFNTYDDDFKENYYKRNMTLDEFNYIRNKIISIQNNKIQLSDKLIYYPTVGISNQTKFSPYLFDIERNCLEKICNIKFICEKCSNIFITKNLLIHKNKIKIYCKDCNFTNNIFKIRTYKNLVNETILYQSKFELKFIRYCNIHKILLYNGPKITYNFNDKNLTYKIDFCIPKLKLLIEIKDNHVWHRDQISSGKWESKLKGVNKYILETDTYNNYIVIYPKNYVELTEKIVRDYWND